MTSAARRIELKILNPRIGKDLSLPKRATAGSAGLDLRACLDAPLELAAGETKRITLPVSARTLGQVDEAGNRIILPGDYTVLVGGTQPGDSDGGVVGKVRVSGTRTLPR